MISFLITILKILLTIIPVLIAVAFFTLFERKVIGFIQRRLGPNYVGIFGSLQPIADGLKLMIKEPIYPSNANQYMYLAAPVLILLLSLINWVLIPFDKFAVISDLDFGILFILGISSLNVYGIIIAGWASNSKYAFLGALRAAAQFISYEVSIGIVIIAVLLPAGSLNLTEIVLMQKNVWYMLPFFPLFWVFLISTVAETNRHPFDMPEAEPELVSGYNVEYSSVSFAFFFIGEYANILFMCAMNVILFCGGWLPIPILGFFLVLPPYFWFTLKLAFIVWLFVYIRAMFPRYRYDRLMRLGWKNFLPVSLGFFLGYNGLFVALNYCLLCF